MSKKQSFTVISLDRYDLLDFGFTEEQVEALSDKDMEYIASQVAEQIDDEFTNAVQNAVNAFNSNK